MTFEAEEVYRTNRAMIAVQLQKFPEEVDGQPIQDIWDVLAVLKDQADRVNPRT